MILHSSYSSRSSSAAPGMGPLGKYRACTLKARSSSLLNRSISSFFNGCRLRFILPPKKARFFHSITTKKSSALDTLSDRRPANPFRFTIPRATAHCPPVTDYCRYNNIKAVKKQYMGCQISSTKPNNRQRNGLNAARSVRAVGRTIF